MWSRDIIADSLPTDIDFEVLRRDICYDLDRDDLSELRNTDHLRGGPQTHLSYPDSRPGETPSRYHSLYNPTSLTSKPYFILFSIFFPNCFVKLSIFRPSNSGRCPVAASLCLVVTRSFPISHRLQEPLRSLGFISGPAGPRNHGDAALSCFRDHQSPSHNPTLRQSSEVRVTTKMLLQLSQASLITRIVVLL